MLDLTKWMLIKYSWINTVMNLIATRTIQATLTTTIKATGSVIQSSVSAQEDARAPVRSSAGFS